VRLISIYIEYLYMLVVWLGGVFVIVILELALFSFVFEFVFEFDACFFSLSCVDCFVHKLLMQTPNRNGVFGLHTSCMVEMHEQMDISPCSMSDLRSEICRVHLLNHRRFSQPNGSACEDTAQLWPGHDRT